MMSDGPNEVAGWSERQLLLDLRQRTIETTARMIVLQEQVNKMATNEERLNTGLDQLQGQLGNIQTGVDTLQAQHTEMNTQLVALRERVAQIDPALANEVAKVEGLVASAQATVDDIATSLPTPPPVETPPTP